MLGFYFFFANFAAVTTASSHHNLSASTGGGTTSRRGSSKSASNSPSSERHRMFSNNNNYYLNSHNYLCAGESAVDVPPTMTESTCSGNASGAAKKAGKVTRASSIFERSANSAFEPLAMLRAMASTASAARHHHQRNGRVDSGCTSTTSGVTNLAALAVATASTSTGNSDSNHEKGISNPDDVFSLSDECYYCDAAVVGTSSSDVNSNDVDDSAGVKCAYDDCVVQSGGCAGDDVVVVDRCNRDSVPDVISDVPKVDGGENILAKCAQSGEIQSAAANGGHGSGSGAGAFSGLFNKINQLVTRKE